ncbi:MAG: hypothetical protein HKN41_07565 [Ilumatobacter sp.]|nr:hypothetical protein [Ilumatobacter sp.]
MAGILDKIKGMLGGGKSADGAGGSVLDGLKDKAGDVKDKVDDLVDKAGDKVPDKVKDTYDQVSDKVEDVIPGDDDTSGQ